MVKLTQNGISGGHKLSYEMILMCFAVATFVYIVIIANIWYWKDLKNNKNEKTEEEKDQEWLDDQW